MTILPYKKESDLGKKEQVALMFDNISHKYDFLNTFLSAGTDKQWRRTALKLLRGKNIQHLLDVATGTGEFALEALTLLSPEKITGVDISKGMLEMGQKKLEEKKLTHKIDLVLGDSEKLPFDENKFDAVTVAFGVRNFENLSQGLADIYRVLKPGGTLIVLEFSQPQRFPVKQVYNFYFKNILPLVGKMVSKDTAAYTYLPESVGAFPYGKQFTAIMEKVGFKSTAIKPLTFGIASVYSGSK